jgi:hypothetical protein
MTGKNKLGITVDDARDISACGCHWALMDDTLVSECEVGLIVLLIKLRIPGASSFDIQTGWRGSSGEAKSGAW